MSSRYVGAARRCGSAAADRPDFVIVSGGDPERIEFSRRDGVQHVEGVLDVDGLVAKIRSAAFSHDDALVARIDAAIDSAASPGDVGRLLVAKTLAVPPSDRGVRVAGRHAGIAFAISAGVASGD
jgi:hypothetical protein